MADSHHSEKQPLISVIVPVYKVEQFLDECVQSIIGQSYNSFEVILVDDGSPDNCPRLCDEYAASDSRIRVIHKANGGLSDARNAGIQSAKGDYVIFIDSDDYWMHSEALAKLADIVSQTPNVDIVFFGRTTFVGQHVFPGPELNPALINGKSKTDALTTILRENAFVGSACQKLLKRSLLVNHNLYFEKGLLSEDWDWSIRVYQYAKVFAAVADNFYGYRKREGSISESFSLKHANDMLYIISKWDKTLTNSTEDSPFRGFLAYCLCCTLGSIELLPRSQRSVKNEFKPYAHLLTHDSHPKVRQAKFLHRIGGFAFMTFILGAYLKHRPKRLK